MALPYAALPAFILKLRSCDAGKAVRLALVFLILTAGRTREVAASRAS